MEVAKDGPYITAALICEKVLQEKDETVSIIRLIDRVTLTVPASSSPESLPPIPLNLSAFISFKSGNARGSYTVKWRTEAPSGLKMPDQLLPVFFEGEDRGSKFGTEKVLGYVFQQREEAGYVTLTLSNPYWKTQPSEV